MQTYLFPLWYSSYYVLCIFKCVKHHVCLAGLWDSNRRETGFVFSLTEILILVFLYHYVGLLRELVKKNYHIFPVSLHFLCTKRKMHIFAPAQGNARKRKHAKPQCKKQCLLCYRAFSQQTGRLHAHIGNCKTKKRNSPAHILECLRTISVPANLLPAWIIMKTCSCGRPHTCHYVLQMEHLPSQFQILSFFCPAHPYSRVQESKNTVEGNLHPVVDLLVKLVKHWSDFVSCSTWASRGAAASREQGLTASGGGGFPAERQVWAQSFSGISFLLPIPIWASEAARWLFSERRWV